MKFKVGDIISQGVHRYQVTDTSDTDFTVSWTIMWDEPDFLAVPGKQYQKIVPLTEDNVRAFKLEKNGLDRVLDEL